MFRGPEPVTTAVTVSLPRRANVTPIIPMAKMVRAPKTIRIQ